MDDIKHGSKKLAWLLRHGATESGLLMDTAGFAAVDDVLRLSGLSRAELEVVVAENNKSRYELRGEKIRACQGHSAGTPVTREGLEGSWDVVAADDDIFHGTSVAAARVILVEGLSPMERSHVHLAESETATVGKRANVDVLLAVSPAKVRAAGLTIYRASNGVILARSVPASAIVAVVAQSRPGERALTELKALLRA